MYSLNQLYKSIVLLFPCSFGLKRVLFEVNRTNYWVLINNNNNNNNNNWYINNNDNENENKNNNDNLIENESELNWSEVLNL